MGLGTRRANHDQQPVVVSPSPTLQTGERLEVELIIGYAFERKPL